MSSRPQLEGHSAIDTARSSPASAAPPIAYPPHPCRPAKTGSARARYTRAHAPSRKARANTGFWWWLISRVRLWDMGLSEKERSRTAPTEGSLSEQRGPGPRLFFFFGSAFALHTPLNSSSLLCRGKFTLPRQVYSAEASLLCGMRTLKAKFNNPVFLQGWVTPPFLLQKGWRWTAAFAHRRAYAL